MRAHLVQLATVWEDRDANYEKTRLALIGQDRILTGRGIDAGDLVVLTEMFDTGFSFRTDITADSEGKTLAFLQKLSKELKAYVQGSRTLIGPDGRGRNMATITGPRGELVLEYAKMHPFSFGRETEFFTGGDQVATFDWTHAGSRAVVCPTVCYDLRFPELYRAGLLKGATVFALGSNWPGRREGQRDALAIARAIENQAYVLVVNRAGSDPHLSYLGGSIAVSPKGEILGKLNDEEAVLSVEIDLEALRHWRSEFPAWKDLKLLDKEWAERIASETPAR